VNIQYQWIGVELNKMKSIAGDKFSEDIQEVLEKNQK
jgi:hypothetical protein